MSVDTRICLQPDCVAHRRQLADILRVLSPSLQPGGDAMDALEDVLLKARKVMRQRDAYRSAVARVASLVTSGYLQERELLPEELAVAIYVAEEDVQ